MKNLSKLEISREILETIQLREKTDPYAQWTTAANPYFKLIGALGFAGLSVASGGSFLAIAAFGLGTGAMIGNAMKKTLNPEESPEKTRYLIAKALTLPVVRSSVLFAFKDANFELRQSHVRMGNTEGYHEVDKAVRQRMAKFQVFGQIVCGMVLAQAGFSSPLEILKALKEVNISPLDPEIYSQLKEASERFSGLQEELGIPEDGISAQAVAGLVANKFGFDLSNVEDGAPGLINRLERLADAVGKPAEFLSEAAEANESLQEAMGTQVDGVASLGAYTKNKAIADRLLTMQKFLKRVSDLKTEIPAEAFIELLNLVDEQRAFRDSAANPPKGPGL